MRKIYVVLATLLGTIAGRAQGIDEFEHPPINYSSAVPHNRVAELQDKLERGAVSFEFERPFGYLRSLLNNLRIPVESQMLVYSKTSLQRNRISPRTPRAIYFDDDVYVGYCHTGDILEISVADPRLGAVFYALKQVEQKQPVLERQTENCLLCHGGSRTDNIPGHLVRSLFVDAAGQPILSEGSHLIDHTTPLENRWGGWYVTGTHGQQRHLGNLIVENQRAPRPWIRADHQNVVDLGDRFPVGNYLTSHSDIVALMVLEHQTFVHNLITKANFATRQALWYEAEFNRSLGEPEDHRLESTTRRIESAAERLVQGMLFVDETPLTARITGTSGYTERFAHEAIRDRRGRSLRDLDLTTRLFKHPCSYLVYSEAFDALPPRMRQCVAEKLHNVLDGGGGETYAHLSADDRQAIREILHDTKPTLWQAADD